MEALNRPLRIWFEAIHGRRLRLPRFQRFEAWSHNEVASLVETVLRGLPAGAVLTLEVGAQELFVSRELESAPPLQPGDRVTEHLLDGQQRLTALWRSLHDNYPNRTYYVRFEEDEDGAQVPRVLGQYRWERRGATYPLWCDDAAEVLNRGYVPLRLLNPLGTTERDAWALKATGGVHEKAWAVNNRIQQLAAKIAAYNIPYLSLSDGTPKDVALDVFIKMNTSSVRLTAFDIVVAQLEEATGQSLHELVDELTTAVPTAHRYVDPGTLALDVAALRSNRPANQQSYQRMDLVEVANEWEEIVSGIKWAIEILEEERIFDAQRLPSVTPLPVIAALHQYVPQALDAAGNARRLVKAYLWRSFLTRRYDQSAPTRALQDYRGLRSILAAEPTRNQAPIFDEDATPLPMAADLVAASWPRGREVLARGILAISLLHGARDIADDEPATAMNLDRREYHHLFPDSLLLNVAKLEPSRSMRALNCALITWSTNRNISNKSPLQYLEDRTSQADLGVDSIRERLASHVVPFEELAGAGPYAEGDRDRLVRDYEEFLTARAELLVPIVRRLCGSAPLIDVV